MKPTKSLLTVVSILSLAGASLLGAGVAAASPSATPNNLTGAANMTNANATKWYNPTPGSVTKAGMPHAMTVNLNGNGDSGMWCAVQLTNGLDDVSCPGG